MRSRALLAAMLVAAAGLLSGTPVWGQDAAFQREINEAIDRGVAYLRTQQDKHGRWPYKGIVDKNYREVGATALAAWTLLECGAKTDDQQVQKAAKVLREDCIPINFTYAMSVAILFFDRLGDPADEPLIHSLALRLMISQSNNGGWTYSIAGREPPASEIDRLSRHYLQVQKNPAARGATPAAHNLAPEIRLQLASFQGPSISDIYADNSNTQFAILALWVARRHGMPVDASLALTAKRFRDTQVSGCWVYNETERAQLIFGGPDREKLIRGKFGSVTAMTCAGLLGLALGYPQSGKNAKQALGRELARDPHVDLGLKAVGLLIGTPQADRRNVPKLLTGESWKGGSQDYSCYCLWTLMRMARVYDLPTIGKKDWYVWGAQILVANQLPDGSWKSDCPVGEADTSFALLFLKRANVAQDLTDSLKGKVKDPGKASPNLLQMIGKENVATGKGRLQSPEKSREIPHGANEGASPSAATVPAEDPAKLATQISAATPAQQEALLEKLRDTPGSTYTEALAGAIPKLRGTAKSKARQALSQRFEQLDSAELRSQLKAAESEMRRAAAMAAGAKKARELGSDLVRLLEDHEVTVQQAARNGLRQMSGQDFGPEVDASPAERTAAVEAWRRWCRQQK